MWRGEGVETFHELKGENMTQVGLMTFTDHEASELCRMAQAAYREGRNDVGHLCSGINGGDQCHWERFDKIKSIYRAWLVFNEWPAEAV